MDNLITSFREEFSILSRNLPHGQKLTYFDAAASQLTPDSVIGGLSRYYEQCSSNVHRGVHQLSELGTDIYEQARLGTKKYFGLGDNDEAIFTYGTTDAINALCFGLRNLVASGDVIVLSALEHHANLVPWQVLAQEKGVLLEFVALTDNFYYDQGDLKRILEKHSSGSGSSKVKLVSLGHASNALGVLQDARAISRLVKSYGALMHWDGAQAAAHMQVDFQDLGCDFYSLSAHKIYGPTGIGFLLAKRSSAELLSPYRYGGSMIRRVKLTASDYADIPTRFEAGTPAISAAWGWHASIEFLQKYSFKELGEWERELGGYFMQAMQSLKGVEVIAASARERLPVYSLKVDGVHPHDLGTLLDEKGIAVRSGHHCCQPLMELLGLSATTRVSLSPYNSKEEIDLLVTGLEEAINLFN